MKTLQLFQRFAVLFCAVLTLSFVSACSDDDEETASSIVGTWTLIGYYDEEEFHLYDQDYSNIYIFNSDGTGIQRSYYDGSLDEEYAFDWRLEGSRIYLSVDGFGTVKFSDKRMEIHWDADEDEETEVFERM